MDIGPEKKTVIAEPLRDPFARPEPTPAEQIPIVEHGKLWCSCDTAVLLEQLAEQCPGCGRSTAELRDEAAYNAQVMAYVERQPIDWGCPTFTESKVEWWARMAAAYEAAQKVT